MGKATEKDWDKYWTKKKTKSQEMYRVIASFYRQFIIKRALNYFIRNEFKKNATLLHAGSGSGQVDADIISSFNITALDISDEALEIYKSNYGERANPIKGDIFKLPMKKSSFDGIYNLGVHEHFTSEENEKILNEYARVLRSKGKIILFWPPKYGVTVIFLSSLHFILNKILRFNIKLQPEEISLIKSKREIEDLLKKTGFKMTKFYFGPKDLFTHVIVIARKSA
ncbi:MAG: hypothetical protein ACD_37C00076G0004 [uncultured bacterium]|nr:MAG: hypothetical protein ACD_37C00076G0004 [uncultured bacterium]